MTKKPLDNSQFSPEELLTAKREFDFLYDGKIENPCEYLERKRNRDMRNLIFHIIENELDEARKEIFKRVFFGGEKISDVAKEMNICVSNAYKHYDKALKRIEESLKYVVFYQNECLHNRLKPLEVMKASSLRYRGSASSPQISMRLSRLMQTHIPITALF